MTDSNEKPATVDGSAASHCYTPQPLVVVDEVVRFRANAIVRYLLDSGPFDMNHLATLPFSDADREQFAQLIGYSLGGFSELDYVSDEAYDQARESVENLR